MKLVFRINLENLELESSKKDVDNLNNIYFRNFPLLENDPLATTPVISVATVTAVLHM